MWQYLSQSIPTRIAPSWSRLSYSRKWQHGVRFQASISLVCGVFFFLQNPVLSLVRRGPATLGLTINRVTAAATLDLPPLDQRPTLYATLELDGSVLTTDTNTTPYIGASIYPDWGLTVSKETMWLQRGHLIPATVRIFDQDADDADDKVLLASMLFDPIACHIVMGDDSIDGDRDGRSCSVGLTDIRGENGSVNLTLTSNW